MLSRSRSFVHTHQWSPLKSSSRLKLGWILVVLAILLFVWRLLPTYYTLPPTVTIPQGGGLASIEKKLSWVKSREFLYARRSARKTLPIIQPGTYRFSGDVTFEEIVDVLKAGPSIVYASVTILEGRSSYDIDAKLVQDGLIDVGAYRKAITDPARIATLQQKYEFLWSPMLGSANAKLASLEWFLYPDTYNVDTAKDPIGQLIYLQLENRKKKIWEVHQQDFADISSHLKQQWYTFNLTPYEALVLASIVQKEERSAKNKPAVMSVFYNRIETKMQLDADISLCYGLERPYSACTPAVIVDNLQDKNNQRNTRARAGVPPTPIANPDSESMGAVFSAQKSPYFFYLHDTSGVLHLAKDLSEHQMNKSKYLY